MASITTSLLRTSLTATAIGIVFLADISIGELNFNCPDEKFALGQCMLTSGFKTQDTCQSCSYMSLSGAEPFPEDCAAFGEIVCGTLYANCSDACAWSACKDNFTAWADCAADYPGNCTLDCAVPTPAPTAAPTTPNITNGTDASPTSGVYGAYCNSFPALRGVIAGAVLVASAAAPL